MSARTLLERLRQRNVRLEAEGDLLHIDAPAGVITADLRDALIKSKPRLLRLLQVEQRRRDEADRRGLAIQWSEYPTWIKLHDPLTGEWHEVRVEECLA